MSNAQSGDCTYCTLHIAHCALVHGEGKGEGKRDVTNPNSSDESRSVNSLALAAHVGPAAFTDNSQACWQPSLPVAASTTKSVSENPGLESRLQAASRRNRLKAGLQTQLGAFATFFQTRSKRRSSLQLPFAQPRARYAPVCSHR